MLAKLLKWLFLLNVLGLLGLGTGCATRIHNQGEVGFRYGTEFTFFSRAAQTAPEDAEAELKSQPLAEFLARQQAKTEAPAATESPAETDDASGGGG